MVEGLVKLALTACTIAAFQDTLAFRWRGVYGRMMKGNLYLNAMHKYHKTAQSHSIKRHRYIAACRKSEPHINQP